MVLMNINVARANLINARLAHSAARKAVNARPIGLCPELVLAEREAYAAVEVARAAFEAAQARQVPVGQAKPMTCCHAAVDVRGTHYARETNCVLHGNCTIGTCD